MADEWNTDWNEFLLCEAVPRFGPVGETGDWVVAEDIRNNGVVVKENMYLNNGVVDQADMYRNNGVAEGDWLNNRVVEGMEKKNCVGEGNMLGKKAAESMVGAAGSSSESSPYGLGDQGPAGNEEYSGFPFHVLQSSGFAFGVSESTVMAGSEMGPEWMVGGAPPPAGSMEKRTPSFLIQTGSAGNDGGSSGSGSQEEVPQSVVGVEAPRGNLNLGNKRPAEWMGSAPPGARASKRQRSLSGSIETGGGSSDEAMGSEFSRLAAAVVAALGIGGGGGGGAKAKAKKPKPVWWSDVVNKPGYTDAEFKRDFRMWRSTYNILCGMLDPSVRKVGTSGRPTIDVPLRVAVGVFHLATGAKLRELCERFGICVTSCHKIVREVLAAINTVLKPGSVSALWSAGANATAAAAEKFRDLTGGIPGVIGAVYTSHVPINAPEHHALQYRNGRRSGKTDSYSVTIQAAVDADGAFTDLCVGNPGSMSQEKIFLQSPMSEKRAAEMVAQGKRLVGGAAYPLTDWTLVPYTHGNLTLPQHNLNEKVALARGVAVDAFRRLKARWKCLQKRAAGKKLDDLSSVMEACCVLHNFCESRGDELGEELQGFRLEDAEIMEKVLDNPVRSLAAAQVRDEIAHNLLHG